MERVIKIGDPTEAMLVRKSLEAALGEIVKSLQPEFKQKLIWEKWSNLADDLMRAHPFRRYDKWAFNGLALGEFYFVLRIEYKKFLGIPYGERQQWLIAGLDVGYPEDDGNLNINHIRKLRNGIDCVASAGKEDLNIKIIDILTGWANRWNIKLTIYADHLPTKTA